MTRPREGRRAGGFRANRRLRAWARGVMLVALVALIGLAIASGIEAQRVDPTAPANIQAVLALPIAAAYLIPGTVLILRRSGHVVGWVLAVLSFALAILFANGWGGREVTPVLGIDRSWWLWIENLVMHALFFFWLVALFVLFPDGLRAQRPNHRRRGMVLLSAGALLTAITSLSSDLRIVTDGPTMASPVPGAFVPLDLIEVLVVGSVLLVLIAAAHLIARSRTATASERFQFRWILLAIGALAIGFPIGMVGTLATGNESWWFPMLIGYFGVPTAITVAILRYRLFEVDRLASRTVTYGTVVALLALCYAGLVVALRALVPVEGDLPVALSTLVVALAFLPLVRRVQRVVDRRFFRSRYDAGVVVARVAEELRGSLDLAEVTDRTETVVTEVFAPETVAIWVAKDRT
jgi:hypothetical protein